MLMDDAAGSVLIGPWIVERIVRPATIGSTRRAATQQDVEELSATALLTRGIANVQQGVVGQPNAGRQNQSTNHYWGF